MIMEIVFQNLCDLVKDIYSGICFFKCLYQSGKVIYVFIKKFKKEEISKFKLNIKREVVKNRNN